jgi:hypothetical protein
MRALSNSYSIVPRNGTTEPLPEGAGMILRMAAWLTGEGYSTDLTKPGCVIWAIDRHYPGGFNRFTADSVGRRRLRTLERSSA